MSSGRCQGAAAPCANLRRENGGHRRSGRAEDAREERSRPARCWGRSGSAAAVGSPALAYGAAAAAGRPLPFALIWFWGECFLLCNEGYAAKIIIYMCRERENPTPIHCHPAPPLLPKASLPQLKKIKITPRPPRSWRSLPPYIKGSGGTRWIPSGYGGCCAAAPPPRCRREPRNPQHCSGSSFFSLSPSFPPPSPFACGQTPLAGLQLLAAPTPRLVVGGVGEEYRGGGAGEAPGSAQR